MHKKTKTVLFILLLILLWIPLFQEITRCFDEPELKGAFVKPLKPHLSIDSLKSLQFQKKFENYENYNFGFRGFFVKLKNSMQFILFREVNNLDLILGKNGYIFSWGSVERTMGRDYNGKDKNEQSLLKIKTLQEAIEKHGAHLFCVIASSKESLLPDMLPSKSKEGRKNQNDYTDFIQGFKKYSIPYIDFCSYFKKIIDTSSFPIVTKTGFHWSMYGASLAQDSLLKYIQYYLPKPIPYFKRQGVEWSTTARQADADFEEPMNLFFSLNQDRYAYPKMEMVKSSLKNFRPKVIIIGDSYFWQIKMLNDVKFIFADESKFWYYFATSFPIGDIAGTDIKKIDVLKELESADFVVLLGSVGTLNAFPYGVTDYYAENKQKTTVEECIRNCLATNLQQLAETGDLLKSKNIHPKYWINLNAASIYKNRTEIHLRVMDNKYVCADGSRNGQVIANRDYPGKWETFSLLKLENNKVAIYSYNNRFFSAELHNANEITATRDYIGSWEIFTMVELENNFVAFKAANGKYLSVDEKSHQLFASNISIGKNEKFVLTTE